jgi:hypothetical protein
MSNKTVRYTLRVFDKNGKPKQGIIVSTTWNKIDIHQKRTDSSGKVEFKVPQDFNLLWVDAGSHRFRHFVKMCHDRSDTFSLPA